MDIIFIDQEKSEMKKRDLVYFLRPCNISDFQKNFEAVAASGISSVVLARHMGEFDLLNDKDLVAVMKRLAALGLKSSAVHGLFDVGFDPNLPDESRRENMLEKHRIFLANSAKAGCLTYVFHSGQRHAAYSEDFLWDQVRKAMDKLIPFAEKQNIVIALENANPGHLGDDSKALAAIAKEFASPFLRLCFDSGHAHRAEDELTVFGNMAPYLATCHLHDNDKSADQHLLPGHGTINWESLIPKIKACDSLQHVETEAFNIEGWSHKEIFRHYQTFLE